MGENRSMSDDRGAVSIEVGLLLNQVHSLATKRLNAALKPMGLTSRHVAVMFLIRDGVKTQRDLVARMNSDKTGMVRVVDDLERLGHLSRTSSATDRRVTILGLTDEGEAALRTAQLHTKSVADELFQAVGPEDLDSLKVILTRTLGVAAPPSQPGAGASIPA